MKLSDPNLAFFLVAGAVVTIIFVIVITAIVQESYKQTFDQMITVGPVWNGNVWTCTSDADFLVYSVLRGLRDAQLAINVSGVGTQSLYSFEPGHMESFTVGANAGSTITLTSKGTISGFITLQTNSFATASCTQ